MYLVVLYPGIGPQLLSATLAQYELHSFQIYVYVTVGMYLKDSAFRRRWINVNVHHLWAYGRGICGSDRISTASESLTPQHTGFKKVFEGEFAFPFTSHVLWGWHVTLCRRQPGEQTDCRGSRQPLPILPWYTPRIFVPLFICIVDMGV